MKTKILGGNPSEVPLTADEKQAIADLHKLAKKWPKSIWLYSASGTLCVMRYTADGEQPERGISRKEDRNIAQGESEQDYIIDTIAIPNDGGDF